MIRFNATDRSAWRARPISMLMATWFGIGHLAGGPGTYAAILSLPLIALLGHHLPLGPRVALCAAFTALSCLWSDRAERAMGEHDSRKIVVDEVVGVWVTLVWFDEPHLLTLAIGCLMFRVFDITKPPPVRAIDRAMPGGTGVVMDDVAAGVYAIPFTLAAAWLSAKWLTM